MAVIFKSIMLDFVVSSSRSKCLSLAVPSAKEEEWTRSSTQKQGRLSPRSHRWQQSPLRRRRLLRCQQCSYVTLYSNNLKTHMHTHTGERPHQCSHCTKAFARRDNLVDHLRIHTGERPHRCHLCPMAFTQKTTLDSHVRSHTGEKPFHCRFCPKAFTRRQYQKEHEQKAHS
ncbi:uncharacterized protein LOC144159204 [Haemaphysalis longicornis]